MSSKAFGDLERVFPQAGPPPPNWVEVDPLIKTTAQPPGAWSAFTHAPGDGAPSTLQPTRPEAIAPAAPSPSDGQGPAQGRGPTRGRDTSTESVNRDPVDRDPAGNVPAAGKPAAPAAASEASLPPADEAPPGQARKPPPDRQGAEPVPGTAQAVHAPRRPRPVVKVAVKKAAAKKVAAQPRWIPLPSVLEPTTNP